jgi:TonB family protein
MKRIFALVILCHSVVFGQNIYMPHEVEKQAEPAGGLLYLNQFISSNLQIPFQSAIKGLNGRVFIKGVVEPDGSMSQIEVTKGIDTLCNREAVRVMTLFKAWKPGTVKGEKVRQYVHYPMTFRTKAKTSYDSTRSALVDYFDQKYNPVSDPKKYEYRSILPVDDNGYIRADVVYEQMKGGRWKEIGKANFEKKEIWHKTGYVGSVADSVKAYWISAQDRNLASHSSEAIFQMNGTLLSYTEYELNNKASLSKDYDLNGMVRVLRLFSDSLRSELTWFENGQIKSVIETPSSKQNEYVEPVYINAWDRDGTQRIKDGDGYWLSVEETFARRLMVEQGRIVAGAKNGKWEGKWADSTLLYQENYEKGVLKEGVSYYDGEKRNYTQARINPQFKGGMKEFYKFLGTNIRYPVDAARLGVTGKVKLSFVVREDGTMGEYKVESGVGFGIDDEALRVVKKMSGLWEPGFLRGKTIPVRYTVPINFQLN